MKKLIPLLLITLSLSVNSQITFYHSQSITQSSFETFRTSNLGEKYIGWSNDTITIYNDDWSVYRNVILPTGYSYTDFLSHTEVTVPSVSDNLFNSDTLLEFLCEIKLPHSQYYTVSVINELGQIQFTFPDSINYGNTIIYTINGTYKVLYYVNQNLSTDSVKIFSLPGTLPCSQCNSLTGITGPNSGGNLSGLNVYPNPFNSSLQINYEFTTHQDNPRLVLTDITGRELKVISLVNQSDKLVLNTSDLSKGVIIVSLFGDKENPVSKKVIKID